MNDEAPVKKKRGRPPKKTRIIEVSKLDEESTNNC